LGDSFAQFRFADEKDWAAESSKQDSSVFLDAQSLVRSLHTLPLHLRLNVEADLVQEELPQELPPSIAKGNMPTFTAQKESDSTVAPVQEEASKAEGKTSPDPSLVSHEEELDFLLSLEAPVTERPATCPDGTGELDQQLPSKEPATSPMKAESCEATEEKPKAITSEDLEDWLDSMIS
ncbi:hypothetical protein GDO81_015093, partial [Engystomops pustulosus]